MSGRGLGVGLLIRSLNHWRKENLVLAVVFSVESADSLLSDPTSMMRSNLTCDGMDGEAVGPSSSSSSSSYSSYSSSSWPSSAAGSSNSVALRATPGPALTATKLVGVTLCPVHGMIGCGRSMGTGGPLSSSGSRTTTGIQGPRS